MPGIITHYLCGLESINKTKSPYIKSLVLKHQNVFNLGTQGPDFLFYYKAWPWKDSGKIPDIGKVLHRKKISLIFSEMMKFIDSQCSSKKEVLSAYFLGYLCHYFLDANAHPYVFYKTGFAISDKDDPLKYTCYHIEFETNIDVLMLRKILNLNPYELNVPKIIRIKKTDAEIVGSMYEHIVEKVLNEKIYTAQVVTSINDMYSIQLKLRDSLGLKKTLANILGSHNIISSLIYPLEVKDNIDYLNLEKKFWCLPWNESSKLNSSFDDIFADAVSEILEIYDAYSEYVLDNKSSTELLEILGNRSFNSGADCNLNVKFKYFDCIFETE